MLSRWSKPRAAVYSSTPNFPLEMKWIDPYHPCVLAQELNTERAPGFLEQISTCFVCVSPEGADWRESGQIRCVSSWSCRNRNQIYLRPRSPKTSYLAAWQCTQLGKQATCERMWLCLQALVLLEADHRVVPFPSHSLTTAARSRLRKVWSHFSTRRFPTFPPNSQPQMGGVHQRCSRETLQSQQSEPHRLWTSFCSSSFITKQYHIDLFGCLAIS